MIRNFTSYYRPHRGLFILDMTCAVAASALAVVFPFLTRRLLSVLIPAGELAPILRVLGVMLAIYAVKAFLSYIRVKWGHILGVRMEADMRRDLFAHIQKLSFSYFDRIKTGHLMSRISNDLSVIAEVAHHAPEDLLISLIVLIMGYAVMFVYNPALALISMIPLPFMLLWGIYMGQKMRKSMRKVRKKIADINSTVENSVQGIREVKSFAAESTERKKFHSSNDSFRLAKEQVYHRMARFHSVMDFLRELYSFSIISGGVILIFAGRLELVDLLAFILYVGIILPPIDRLINFTEQLQQGISSFERFREIMDIEPDIRDREEARAYRSTGGEIRIENLSFRYDKSPEDVLKNISLTIPAGSTAALAGESGAGKSTLAALIPRFYEPSEGRILADGQDIADLTQKSLRQNIGIVQQSVFLFDGTIRENILYGNPGAGEEQICQALEAANLTAFIDSLPDGLETEVGEHGVLLSGGQKQRISMARVFLKDPKILILDEATSALDNESESLIQEALGRLCRNRTTLIIAHRLSTIRMAETIYVMKQGEIVEEGSHEELMEMKGYYKTLADRGTLTTAAS